MQTQEETPAEQPAFRKKSLQGLPLRWPDERVAREAELATSWARMEQRLGDYLSEFPMLAWVKPCRLIDADDSHLWISSPTHGWVQERYQLLFDTVACELSKKSLHVLFVSQWELPR